MKSIYINHIPRTGGTTLSRMLYSSGIGNTKLNVFTPQISAYQKKEFNKENILNSDLIMGHYGIAPNILSSNIDTIAFLRNPINQISSMFSKLYKESQDLNNTSIDLDLLRSSKFKNDPINLFNEWLHDESSKNYTNNGQIHNLINTRHPYLYDIDTGQKINAETQNDVNEINAKNKINSLLFLGSTENIYDGYEKIIDIINNRFNTNLSKYHKKRIDNSIDITDTIILNMTKKNIDYILEKNSIDLNYWQIANKNGIDGII